MYRGQIKLFMRLQGFWFTINRTPSYNLPKFETLIPTSSFVIYNLTDTVFESLVCILSVNESKI